MKTIRTALVACLLVCAAVSAACSQSKTPSIKVAAPTASPATLAVVSQTGDGARLLVTLEVTNPNAIPLPLRKGAYTVNLAGIAGGAITLEDKTNLTLPANGTQTLSYPLAVSLSEGQSLSGAAYTISGSVEYEPPGEMRRLLTESGVSLPKVRFSGAGNL